MSRRRPLRPMIMGAGAALLIAALAVRAELSEADAQQRIEALPCGTATVGARLLEQSRAHTRRDLGWRFFREDGSVDAERAMRLSKAMEIRYRWRISPSGKAEAVTEAAQKLCD